MAVTVNQQPQQYMPAFNKHIWVASSSQTAQPGFRYTVVVTDVISGNTQTYQIPANPTGKLIFDSSVFARNLISHYIPANLYGWKQASIREIEVNIGESYDGSPEYHTGADITYYTWNGIVDYLPYQSYSDNDYTYAPTESPSRLNWLSSRLDEKTFEDRSNYLYLIVEEPDKFLGITIESFDANGVLISYSDINSYSSSPGYADNYICIDVGLKGLTNIDAGDISAGDVPIIVGGEAYYNIYERYNDGITGNLTLLKTITVECEPTFPVMTIHYLAKNGRFQTVHFNKMSTRNSTKQSSSYSITPYTQSGGTYTYDYSDGVQKVLSTETQSALVLNTDWISEDEMSLYMDIFDSPVIYLDQGSSIGYASLRCVTNNMQETKRYNKRIFNLTCEFEYNHTNTRQY